MLRSWGRHSRLNKSQIGDDLGRILVRSGGEGRMGTSFLQHLATRVFFSNSVQNSRLDRLFGCIGIK